MKRVFIWSVALVVLVTAVSKLWALNSASQILVRPDPVFRIPYRSVLLGATVLEILLFLILISTATSRVKALVLVVFAESLAGYKLLRWLITQSAACDCFGALTKVLPMSEFTLTAISWSLVGYMLLGGALILSGKLGQQPSVTR